MQDSKTNPQLLAIKEAASRLGLSTATVRGLVQGGLLRCVRIHERGHYRVSETAIAEFISQRESETAACRELEARKHAMNDSQTQPQLLSLREAASRLRLSTATVRGLVQGGLLRCVRIHERGHYRVSETAIAEFISQRDSETAALCRCGRKGGCSR